jgi:hypothetical protein
MVWKRKEKKKQENDLKFLDLFYENQLAQDQGNLTI